MFYRRKAEELSFAGNKLGDKLQSSQTKWLRLFEDMPEGVFYQSADGALIDVNKAALKMFGLTRDEFLNRTSMHSEWDVITEDGEPLPGEKHPSMLALSTGKPVIDQVVGIYHPKVQSYIWVAVSALPEFRYGEEAPYQVVVTMHDMTARKRSEQALSNSENRLKNLIQHLHAGVVVHAEDTSIVLANEQACSLLGLTLEQMMGKGTVDYEWQLFREDGSRMPIEEYPVARVLDTGDSVQNIVIGIDRPNETERQWVLANAFLETEAGSRVAQVVVTFVDITERKRMEDALRATELRQRALIANISDVIAVIDADGINRYKSENVENVFGWRAEDLIGVSTWENVHPDDLEHTQELFASIVKEPKSRVAGECRYRCKDGSYRWIEYTAVNLLDDAAVDGILLNYSDISDRKDMIDALKESEERLRHTMDNMLEGCQSTLR